MQHRLCHPSKIAQLCGAMLHPSTPSWAATIASHCLYLHRRQRTLLRLHGCKWCIQPKRSVDPSGRFPAYSAPTRYGPRTKTSIFGSCSFVGVPKRAQDMNHLTRPGPREKRTTESNLGGSPGGRIVFRGPSTRGELARAWADSGLFR